MAHIFEKISHGFKSKSKSSGSLKNYADESKSCFYGVPELERSRITLIKQLGVGAFEKLHVGKLKGDTPEVPPVDITVRSLKENVIDSGDRSFLRELEFLAETQHVNIICLLGVVTHSKPVCMVLERLSKGCLHKYLTSHSSDSEECTDVLQTKDLFSIASQIAAGMEYLASKGCIYKTLMTSNCYVGENLSVKLAESEIVQERVYTSPDELFAVQWMPPEVLSHPSITIEVNVWNFGVVLWEIFSYGKKPYQGLSTLEVMDRIKSHQLLQCPDACPSYAYDIMLKCWNRTPAERPSFSVLHQLLKSRQENLDV